MVCVELILPMVCFQTYYLIFIFNPLLLYLLLKQLFYHVHFMGHEAQNGSVTKYCVALTWPLWKATRTFGPKSGSVSMISSVLLVVGSWRDLSPCRHSPNAPPPCTHVHTHTCINTHGHTTTYRSNLSILLSYYLPNYPKFLKPAPPHSRHIHPCCSQTRKPDDYSLSSVYAILLPRLIYWFLKAWLKSHLPQDLSLENPTQCCHLFWIRRDSV